MNKPLRWVLLAWTVGALLFSACSFASPNINSASLANTRWSLVSINGQPPIPGRALTLSFQSGGHLAGDSGCNGYGGQFEVNGNTIAVGQLVSTLRACVEQPLNDQEAAFQKALGDASQYALLGNQLTLKNAGGGEVLVFQKQ